MRELTHECCPQTSTHVRDMRVYTHFVMVAGIKKLKPHNNSGDCVSS